MALRSEGNYERDVTLGQVGEVGSDQVGRLGGAVRELVASLFSSAQGYHVRQEQVDESSHAYAIHQGPWRIDLRCIAGNNVKYVAGQPRKYYSFGVHAESTIPAIEKAIDQTAELVFWLRIAGAILTCGLVFLLFRETFLGMFEVNIWVPAVIFSGIAAAGGFLFGRIAQAIGDVREAKVTDAAYAAPVTESVLAAWDTLCDRLQELLNDAEAAED